MGSEHDVFCISFLLDVVVDIDILVLVKILIITSEHS